MEVHEAKVQNFRRSAAAREISDEDVLDGARQICGGSVNWCYHGGNWSWLEARGNRSRKFGRGMEACTVVVGG